MKSKDYFYNAVPNVTLPELDQINQKWIQSFNLADDTMKAFYNQSPYLIQKAHYLSEGPALFDFYKHKAELYKITEFNVVFRVQLSENPSMVYELGNFKTSQKETFQYLFIWSKTNDSWQHELDAIEKEDPDLVINPSIDIAREKWVTLANAKSSIDLARNLYSENFIYYNRGNLFTDYDSLSDAYAYMNDEQFQVDLSKNICIMVSPDYAFDIGTWESFGSTGHYIIIWELVDSEWKIRLDSNW